MSLAEASLGLPVGGSVHRHTRSCRRARGRQGRFAPLKRWPEGGPSLTATARAGMSRVQVGTEGWCRSNKRIGFPDIAPVPVKHHERLRWNSPHNSSTVQLKERADSLRAEAGTEQR